MKNKYVRRGKISEAKFRRLVYLFSLDLTAVQIADLANLNRNTVNRYLKGIRNRIVEFCEVLGPPYCKLHSPNAAEHNPVIGILCRDQKVHLGMLAPDQFNRSSSKPNKLYLSEKHLSPLLQSFDALYDPIDEWKYYIKNDDDKKHQLRKKTNRIDGFIGFTRSRLQKFKGLKRNTLYLHLKECEFRFNQNKDEYYHLMLKILRNNPLF